MLHIETIEPATLELLKKIQSIPEFQGTRLVGGTALALQIGHRQSVDLDFIDIATLLQIYTLKQILDFYQSKYPNSSLFMATKSLLYFDDAEKDAMPRMFSNLTWKETKQMITSAVEKYS